MKIENEILLSSHCMVIIFELCENHMGQLKWMMSTLDAYDLDLEHSQDWSGESIVAKNHSNEIVVFVRTKQFSWFTLTMLGKVIKKTWPLVWPTIWTRAVGGSTLSSVLGKCAQLAFPELEAAQEHILEIVVMKLSGQGAWLDPVKTSIQTFKIWLLGAENYRSFCCPKQAS